MASAKPHAIYGRLTASLRKEAKKAAVLTFLVALLFVLWVRMAMRNGEAPARANAASNAKALSAALEGGGGKGNEAASAFKNWLNAPTPDMNRNIFAINLDHFPQEYRTAVEQANSGGGFWGELAKSVSAKADVTKERQILLENLQQQASQLRLQTTVMGAKPKAVVNGEFVKEGDVVASGTGEARTTFRVIKIEARRIIVEREGIKLEIPMK
ncbi:MAG TPA: hypothetical protein VF669_06045 [Tepidisphaeraceae bacterium]|jgi:hypothetical protein